MYEQENMRRARLLQAQEEIDFELAMLDAVRKEGEGIARAAQALAGEPEAAGAPEFEALWQRHEQRRVKRKWAALHPFARVAAACITVVVLLAGSLATAQAIGLPVLSWFDSQKGYVVLRFAPQERGEEGARLGVEWSNAYIPSGIPDEFVVQSLLVSPDLRQLDYVWPEHPSAYITFSMQFAKGDFLLNADMHPQSISIGPYVGLVGEKDGVTIIIWQRGSAVLKLIGSLPKQQMMAIAKSVELKK